MSLIKSEQYLFNQDWPDCMAMDEKMFANYAEQLEKEDFEDEVCDQSRSYNHSRLDFAQLELKVLFPGARSFLQHPPAGRCAAGDDFQAASKR